MKCIFSVLVTLLCLSCNTQPQVLVVGKDVCYFCKMPVADARFGAELITVKGKIYKFDDIGCMISFMKNDLPSAEKTKDLYVVSYENNQKLMHVNETVFLKSAQLHTPMNSGIAACASHDEAASLMKEFPGEILTWQQLQ